MSIHDMLKVKYYKKILSLLKLNFIGKLIKKGKKLYAWKIFFLLQLILKKNKKISKFNNFNSFIK